MPKTPRKLTDILADKRPAKPDVATLPDTQPIRTEDLGGGQVRRVFKNLQQVREWATKQGRTLRVERETPDLMVAEATDEEKAMIMSKKRMTMARLAAARRRELESEAEARLRDGNPRRGGNSG